MRSRWTLAVEGLGRIDRAEVEVRPLTLFVGDNNSGKSYLASLLWDFHARMPEVFDALGASPYDICARWATDKLARAEDYTLTREDQAMFLSWANAQLARNKDAIARRLFQREGMKVEHLRIESFHADKPLELTFRLRKDSDTRIGIGSSAGSISFDFSRDTEPPHDVVLIATLSKLFRGPVVVGVRNRSGGRYSAGDPVYLPASRTGFVLLYKGVLASLIDRGLAGTMAEQGTQPAGVQLTLPAVHFLQLLALGLEANERGPFAAEADLLERGAFPGTVAIAGGVGVNDVEYRYDLAAPPLPMQLSSSLITELAPLILVLRHVRDLPFLVLEEPEAHLHPHIVRLVARVIARLVRKGAGVCVTTHSADFCQQINNFIKLGSLSGEQRAAFQAQYGYDADDYLDASEVAGYQFQVGEGGGSTVTRLAESPSGLAMPTFNEELYALSRQTLDLQRAVEGDS